MTNDFNSVATRTVTTPAVSSKAHHPRIYIVNANGRASTVPILSSSLAHLLQLARGAGANQPHAHVAKVMRQVSRDMVAEGYACKWAPEVRRRALLLLRGTYRPALADAFDRAQFPDGQEVQS